MKQGANVQSIEAIRRFRAKLIEFAEMGQRSLSEAEFDIQRTMSWLQHEQLMHWKSEIKRRKRAIEQCKSELFRAQISAEQSGGSARDEMKALRRAEANLEEAEQKLKAVQRWIRLLDREMTLYKGQCGQLATALQGAVPKASVLLEKMAENLDAYVQLAPPDHSGTPTSHAADQLATEDRASRDGAERSTNPAESSRTAERAAQPGDER